MSVLKNIIFDLGGVLLNLDFARSTQAFRDLGFPHFEKMYSQFKVDKFFEKLETGTIGEKEFYTVLLKIGNKGISKDEIRSAWNSLLLDFRVESLDFLTELKSGYRLFLLSNTNLIHYEAFNIKLKVQTGLDSLDTLFTKCYYSHLIGLRKPNNNIYDFVLGDAGINVKESLFIDDTRDNTFTAQKMGFKTHVLMPGEKIETLDYSGFNDE